MQNDSACRRLIMIAAILVGTQAGCSSGLNPSPVANSAASAATTHGGSSGSELVLPIDAYAYTVPERDKLGWARDILIGRCMRAFGLSYDAAADKTQNSELARTDIQDNGLHGNKRRYDVTDMAIAMKYGYHLVSTVDASAANQGNPHGLGKLTATGRQILSGAGPDGKPVARSATGRTIPPGGCVGAADATLAASSGQIGEAEPVSSLDGLSYQQSLKNRKVTAAFRAWSVCMGSKGYHFASPLDANAGFNLDTKTVSARERSTARADVSCKRRTHLVDTWFGVEVAYQKTYIQQHADQFHQAKTDHDAVMKKVATIVSGNR